jgi:hypothetical protein
MIASVFMTNISTVVDYGPILLNAHNEDKA